MATRDQQNGDIVRNQLVEITTTYTQTKNHYQLQQQQLSDYTSQQKKTTLNKN